MTKTFFPKALASISVLLLATAMHAQTTDANQPTRGNSKARIVRLSQVKGEVQVDRNTERGFEDAMANLPIVEESQLRTVDGVAEVEFEDNSTLRLAPNSLVEFPRLERLPTGKTASTVHLLRGTAYISLLKTPGDQFTLLFGERKLDLQPATHIRLEMENSQAKLAVLDGSVRVEGPTGTVDVPKKKTATFQTINPDPPIVAKDIAPGPFDEWDKNAAGYHSRMPSMSALNNSPYSYGLGDMGYYGSFMNAGGCGSMWRPYFASASWDPFSNGAWAYYPGAGYSWVSPYPWGWTPYHSGSWAYCNGTGWGWQPGGMWSGLNNVAVVAPRSGSGGGLLPPTHGPRPGEPTLLPVNRAPLVRSDIAQGGSFVFRKDSAGMGVPRETLGHLDKLSRQTENRGTASLPIYVSAPQPSNGRSSSSQTMPTAVHRGSAPSAGPMQPVQGGGSMGRSSAGQTGQMNTSTSGASQSRPPAPAPTSNRR